MRKKLGIAITMITVIYYNNNLLKTKTRLALFKVPTLIKVHAIIKNPIVHMNILHNNKRVIDAYIGDSISIEPYFKFNIFGNKGDIIEILYSDNNDKTHNIINKARGNNNKTHNIINKARGNNDKTHNIINKAQITNLLIESIYSSKEGIFYVEIQQNITNGKTIPITIDATMIEGVEFISLIVHENYKPVAALFNFFEGVQSYVSTAIKIEQSSKVTVSVTANGTTTKITKYVEVQVLK
jgi:predicted secreted protein